MANRLLNLTAALVAVAGASNVALASSGDAPASAAAPNFVALEPIEVPIIGPHKIEGSLRVKLVLDAGQDGSADAISEQLPQVRAISLATTLEFSRLYASGLTPVNAELLRSELTAALKPYDKIIERVLVVEIGAQAA